MGANAVRTIVSLMVLVVVSLFIGAQASDGVKSGSVALGGVIGILCIAALLFLGKKAWWGVFVAPLAGSFLPELVFTGLPLGMVVMPVLFAAWIIMWMMGLVQLRWRTVSVMDLSVLLSLVWYIVSFIRFPVALDVMQLDYDYVGGKEYLFCLLGTIFYVFYSMIVFPTERLESLVKVMFWTTLLLGVLKIILNLMGLAGSSVADSVTVGNETHRVTAALLLGSSLYAYIYTRYPLPSILSSPWKLGGMILAMLSVVISGTREYLVRAAFCLSFFAFLKRELVVLAGAGCVIYAGIFLLSEEELLQKLPLASQRTLLILPGIHGDKLLEQGAEGSSNWRTEIWAWALDPRTGYIRDYICGDGFQTSRRAIQRAGTATLRKTMKEVDQVDYASRGVWHNGFITCLHRTGIVGVVLAFIYFITALVTTVYVAVAYRGSKGLWPYMAVLLLPMLEQVFVYFYMGTIIDIFVTYQQFALLKVFYYCARERGLVKPLFVRKQYVPLVVRELEQEADAAPGKSPAAVQGVSVWR